MQICGLNKTTLLDYPGQVAATIFLGGCNFACPFCHNKDIVLAPACAESYTMDEILFFLEKRRNVLKGVCISGGEPTLHPELPSLIQSIKDLDFLVKLDTNGTNPQIVSALLNTGSIDYIAMDIKTDKEHYGIVSGLCDENTSSLFDMTAIEETIQLLKNCHISYEFRTTVTREFHKKEIFQNIGQWLDGASHYYLQNYVENENVIAPGFHSYTSEALTMFATLLAPHFKHVGIRGV